MGAARGAQLGSVWSSGGKSVTFLPLLFPPRRVCSTFWQLLLEAVASLVARALPLDPPLPPLKAE